MDPIITEWCPGRSYKSSFVRAMNLRGTVTEPFDDSEPAFAQHERAARLLEEKLVSQDSELFGLPPKAWRRRPWVVGETPIGWVFAPLGTELLRALEAAKKVCAGWDKPGLDAKVRRLNAALDEVEGDSCKI